MQFNLSLWLLQLPIIILYYKIVMMIAIQYIYYLCNCFPECSSISRCWIRIVKDRWSRARLCFVADPCVAWDQERVYRKPMMALRVKTTPLQKCKVQTRVSPPIQVLSSCCSQVYTEILARQTIERWVFETYSFFRLAEMRPWSWTDELFWGMGSIRLRRSFYNFGSCPWIIKLILYSLRYLTPTRAACSKAATVCSCKMWKLGWAVRVRMRSENNHLAAHFTKRPARALDLISQVSAL